MKAQMHLAIDVSWTQVETTWREPGARVGRHYPEIGLFEDIARVAECGLLDLIFFGDSTGIPNTWKNSIDDAVRYGVAWPRLDMSPWITAMSRVTKHIGFGLTYATTFMHPFYVARLLNSLDHITNGRIAFNVITSQRKADAQNYGFDELMEHGQRYDRMDEFMDVCRALWTSIDPDAFEWNPVTGDVANPAKVRPINHVGRFFKVKGPLSVPPSPQIVPVLIQAGGSPRGMRSAARFVDHIFGARKPIPLMAKQRAEVDTALQAEGRDPQKVGIIWSTQIMVGETEREAKAMKERLIDRVPREAVGVCCRTTPGSTCPHCHRAFRCANSTSASWLPTLHQWALSECSWRRMASMVKSRLKSSSTMVSRRRRATGPQWPVPRLKSRTSSRSALRDRAAEVDSCSAIRKPSRLVHSTTSSTC
jgi:FMN-dependent oxidoreductase (nitrilotriacetate monooxygenase family)